MDLRLRTTLLCVGAATALALTGCTSSGATAPKPSASGTTASAPVSPPVSAPASPPASSPGSGAPSTVPSDGGSVRPLTFADNGKAVTLHPGERLHVALNSPLWTFQAVDAPQVLRTDSTGDAKATTSCPPPMGSAGCGTKTADFTAVGAGQTSVVATRVICGEAMRCTGSNGRFEVSITVTG